MTALTDARLEAANKKFEEYDFGCEIEDASGWEFETPGDRFSRTIFFAGETSDDDSVRGHFVVNFKPSEAEQSEAYAMLGGNFIGRDPATAAPAL